METHHIPRGQADRIGWQMPLPGAGAAQELQHKWLMLLLALDALGSQPRLKQFVQLHQPLVRLLTD